jgi:hypothetical protein
VVCVAQSFIFCKRMGNTHHTKLIYYTENKRLGNTHHIKLIYYTENKRLGNTHHTKLPGKIILMHLLIDWFIVVLFAWQHLLIDWFIVVLFSWQHLLIDWTTKKSIHNVDATKS